ncbi:MAG: PAS domain S-box protein [Steroidobacteraceae bacterium]|nr:PAS domain S-box protein [Deltaproteobacteria bacterium]
MSEPLNILVIEDSKADFMMVERHLRQNGLSARCMRVDTLAGVKEAIDRESWDLVLSDYNVPLLNIRDSLNLMLTALPDLAVILVTGTVGEEKAVELLKLGVRDFVLKGNLTRLVPAIERGLRDTAERRAKLATERALQNSEAHFRNLFNKSPVAIGIAKIDSGLVVDVNNACLLLYGYERAEMIGRTTTELNLYSRPGERIEIIRLLNECGHVVNREVQVRRKSGENRIVIYSAEQIERGGDFFLQVMLTDVTERKQAEETLRKLYVAVEQSPTATVITDTQGRIEYVNPRFTLLSGYSLEEVLNKNPRILKGNTPAEVHRELWTTISAGNVWRGDFHNKRKDGTSFWEHTTISPIRNESGNITHYMATKEDITEHRTMEAQLRQSQKMEAIGTLAGGVAHDFNNILSAIFGYSHLILDQTQDNEAVKYNVEEIIKASQRAASLTQSLLAFSRKQAVTLSVIDLGEVITGNEAFLRRLIREDIELKITCSKEPLTVMADRGQMEQVIMNLVANARDAMPTGGKLSIETMSVTLDQAFCESHGYGAAGVYSVFSVSDNGSGMDKETQSRIFEPFYTTKEQGKGTGLGLSMSYGIVKKHDGFINVYSEPGTGTIFRIYLPHVQTAAQVEKKEIRGVASLRYGAETVLVGEDDAALRRLSSKVLSHYGYRVIEAQDGQDAVDRFIEFQDSIQLVLLDLVMPKKNGKVACDEMRQLRPDLRVLFTSGYARDIMDENCTFDENTDFIQKPISPNELVAKVGEMLDKKIIGSVDLNPELQTPAGGDV